MLKDTGTLLVISHGLPESRLEYFPRAMWSVEVVEMGTYLIVVCLLFGLARCILCSIYVMHLAGMNQYAEIVSIFMSLMHVVLVF